jgi:hypothetical protein
VFLADTAAASSSASFCSAGESFSKLALLMTIMLFCSMCRLITG